MQRAFPYPVMIKSAIPRLEGLRFSPFTNIDGESFATPALNGFWRLDMTVVARGMQAQLALSSFVTAMSAAGTTCVVPVCTQWRPNDDYGRPMTGCDMAPEYSFDHTGFLGSPFPGFTLIQAAQHRDSYITVRKPALSHLWPGHFLSLGTGLHQVVDVENIDDETIGVSVMPNVRGRHVAGTVVIVDQLRLSCVMESGDQIGLDTNPMKIANLAFVEAF